MISKALQKLSYGLYVLTTNLNGKDNGCIINTAVQVTSNPEYISIAVSNTNYTTELLKESKVFNLSVISEKASFNLFTHFGFQSGRTVNKFLNYNGAEKLSNNVYLVKNGVCAYFACEVISATDLGSHTLFIAKITDMDVLNNDAPATYAYYHASIKPQKKTETTTAKQGKTVWVCGICGYEEEGYEELPDDYTCPLCTHDKSVFDKVIK